MSRRMLNSEAAFDNAGRIIARRIDEFFFKPDAQQGFFKPSEVTCSKCNGKLETHYCECTTYAVRCETCKRITIVVAASPYAAASKAI